MEYLNQIITGDARELAKAIPDESIDLVFCDPPYLREHIEAGVYGWLAQEATRVLKPGGFCLAYTGVYWLATALAEMQRHLAYYWTFVMLHHRGNPYHYERKISNGYKPILAFSKGQGVARHGTLDRIAGSGKDKAFHRWGQDASVAQYYLDCFSSTGDTIYDPFCGGGTIPSVCKCLNRNFIAFEIDPDAAAIARKRLETVQPVLFAQEAEQLGWKEMLA